MSIISTTELQRQATTAVVNRNFEAILLNSTKVYNSTTSYASYVQDEVATTAGGYTRIEFDFDTADIITTATGVSTITKYLTWVHNGNAQEMNFDHILVVERVFSQPLNTYYNVGVYNLGIGYALRFAGERARFSLRFNIKNK
ncbi:MAG: hypothetical protein ACO24P_00690 [Candidatus Nanopelagicaceae bacterium]